MQAKPNACIVVTLYFNIRIWFLASLWKKSHILRGIITWEFGVFPSNSYIKNGHTEWIYAHHLSLGVLEKAPLFLMYSAGAQTKASLHLLYLFFGSINNNKILIWITNTLKYSQERVIIYEGC